jgi:drug/metabolite transporter (DMT)-like permease
MNKRLLWVYIRLTLSVLAWGGSFIATKLALKEVSPITIMSIRFGMGVIVLGFIVFARREFAIPGGTELAKYALLGFIGIAFHQWIQATGLKTVGAGTTAWIMTSIPAFIALFGWLFLREKLKPLHWVGIAIASMGVLLVLSDGSLTGMFTPGSLSLGDILILLSAPNWAVFTILSRRLLRNQPPARAMVYVMGTGWLMTTVYALAAHSLVDIPKLSLTGWLSILFLGVICSGLAYVFYYDALEVIPAAQVGAFIYLEPLVAMLVASLILGEVIYAIALLGGVLIVIGVWLVNRPTKMQISTE